VPAPATMSGLEIEICPSGARHDVPDEGGDWWQGSWRSHTHHPPHTAAHPHEHRHQSAWPHVAVVGRPVADSMIYSAVYPGRVPGATTCGYARMIRPRSPLPSSAGASRLPRGPPPGVGRSFSAHIWHSPDKRAWCGVGPRPAGTRGRYLGSAGLQKRGPAQPPKLSRPGGSSCAQGSLTAGAHHAPSAGRARRCGCQPTLRTAN
jgi:hypothetical protein